MWKKPSVSSGCFGPSVPQKEEYLKGVIISLKGEYAIVKYKNELGEEKIIEILQSKLAKLK